MSDATPKDGLPGFTGAHKEVIDSIAKKNTEEEIRKSNGEFIDALEFETAKQNAGKIAVDDDCDPAMPECLPFSPFHREYLEKPKNLDESGKAVAAKLAADQPKNPEEPKPDDMPELEQVALESTRLKAQNTSFVKVVLTIGVCGLIVAIIYALGLAVKQSNTAMNTTLQNCTAVDNLYQATNGLLGCVSGLNQTVQSLTNDKIPLIEKSVADLAKKNEARDKQLGEFDERIKQVEANTAKDIKQVDAKAEEAKKSAAQALEQQAARVKAENQLLREKLGYIRQANSSCELAKLDDKEVEKQLADGIWNIESQIATEYDRLQSNKASAAQRTAIAATATIDKVVENTAVANQKADHAILAGETAITAVGIIADKPTKAIGHSVGKRTKEEVREALRSYWNKYDNSAGAK